jgi:hypothetical protein
MVLAVPPKPLPIVPISPPGAYADKAYATPSKASLAQKPVVVSFPSNPEVSYFIERYTGKDSRRPSSMLLKASFTELFQISSRSSPANAPYKAPRPLPILGIIDRPREIKPFAS